MPANREQWQMLCQLLSKRKTAECVYIAVLTIAYSAYRSAIFFPSACNCTPHPLCIFIFFTEMCNTTAVSGVLLAVQRCTMTKMCSIPKTEDKGVTQESRLTVMFPWRGVCSERKQWRVESLKRAWTGLEAMDRRSSTNRRNRIGKCRSPRQSMKLIGIVINGFHCTVGLGEWWNYSCGRNQSQGFDASINSTVRR